MILRWCYLLYSLYRALKLETHSNIQRLKNAAHASGVIGKKLLQFVVMHDGMFSTNSKLMLDDVLENCDVHDWAYTVATYNNMFDHCIEDDFIITGRHEPIGSGSIGQVYKLYHRRLEKYVAVKVKHPNVADEVQLFISFVAPILRFVRLPYHVVITEFLHNVASQLDYIEEATNTNTFRVFYENEKHIVIPEIIAASTDIIVMTYHAGTRFIDIEDKVIRKSVANDIFLFMSSSLVCYRFVHCDMHYGNWKYDQVNDKIIVYDCGIVGTATQYPSQVIRNLFLSSLDGDLHKISSSICPSYHMYIHLCMYIDELMKTHYDDPNDRFADFLKRVFELNIDVDKNLLRCLQGLMICMSPISQTVSQDMKNLNIKGTKYTMPVFLTINYERMRRDPQQKYANLADHFGEWLAQDPTIEQDFNEWVHMTT